jgi:hypothetical protein
VHLLLNSHATKTFTLRPSYLSLFFFCFARSSKPCIFPISVFGVRLSDFDSCTDRSIDVLFMGSQFLFLNFTASEFCED